MQTGQRACGCNVLDCGRCRAGLEGSLWLLCDVPGWWFESDGRQRRCWTNVRRSGHTATKSGKSGVLMKGMKYNERLRSVKVWKRHLFVLWWRMTGADSGEKGRSGADESPGRRLGEASQRGLASFQRPKNGPGKVPVPAPLEQRYRRVQEQ